jgi:hypothetical protein
LTHKRIDHLAPRRRKTKKPIRGGRKAYEQANPMGFEAVLSIAFNQIRLEGRWKDVGNDKLSNRLKDILFLGINLDLPQFPS